MTGLLERHVELDALRRTVVAGEEGKGAVAVVLGEAGVGKTRLLDAVRGVAEEAGVRVLVARGAELESSFPFGVVRQLLEPPLAKLGDEKREAAFAGAARLARGLFEHPDLDARPVGDAAGVAVLHGLYWLVANLADHGPMALLVDDAHWSDAASLRFVDYLARRVSGLAVALVVATRSGEPGEDRLLGLESSAGASALKPAPLSARAVARRVRERFGAESDEAFARACFVATGGNPLFLDELLRELEAGGVGPTAEAADVVGTVGPDAVARLTLARLEAIGPEAGELARALAVLGDGADPGLAASAAGLSEEDARVATDRLAATGMLAPERRLRFVHPIVRAAIYQRLLPGERAARHAQAAAHLARAGAPAERIAAHLLLTAPAVDPARVAELAEAARIARARGAPESAAAYLRRALEEPPPADELHGLLLELGRIEHDLHDYAAAEEHLSGALRSLDLGVRAEAARWLARTLMSSGRPDEAIARFDAEIEALAGQAPELTLGLESELLLAAVWSPGHQARLGAWLERFERRAAGLPRFEAVAAFHRALRRMLEGATAAEVGDRTEAALAKGAIDSLEPSFGWALRLLQHSEREEAGLALLEPALARARELGHLSQVQLLCAQRAQFIYAQGRIAEALAEAETGLNAGEGFHPALPLLHAVRLDALRERGELDEAEAGLRRAGLAGEVADRPPFGWLLASRCRLRLAQDRLEEARADFVRGEVLHERLGVSHVVHPDWRAYGAIALARLGHEEEADAVAARQLERARSFAAPRALGTALRATAAVKGGEAGLAHLEEAVAVLEGSPARLVLAQALADYGALLRGLGRRRDSRDPLRRGITLADDCGAPVLAERARAELAAGGGRPPPAETQGVAALTPAERRVAALAAQGPTNREIAQTLFVTEKTVEMHLSRAYRKLGIRSRWQLAEFAGRTNGEAVGAR
ncbi:MAG: AAA family ATPase [Thermoleophilaceae bacterium]|nr:AAA family ATPase [Thermoleophilaceae bacterium]